MGSLNIQAHPEFGCAATRAGIPSLGTSGASVAASKNGNWAEFLLRTARELGPVVQLWPGTIAVTGPEEARHILGKTDSDYFTDRSLLQRGKSLEAGTSALAEWQASRKTILAAMTRATLEEHTNWLIARTERTAGQMLHQRRIDNPMRMLEDVTSASIARYCFGTRQADTIPAAVQTMQDALFPIAASQFDFPAYIRLIQPREWRSRRLHRELRAELRKVLVGSRGTGGLVTAFQSRRLDADTMIKVLIPLLMAAHRVPAAALAWALVEMAKNPAEQDRASAAAITWNPGINASQDVCRVVDETLRLWPPLWVLNRVTSQAVPCISWTIPAGSRVLLIPWVTHRLAPCYLDAEKFDSNRWETLSQLQGAYIPFGGRPRRCPGAQFSYTEMNIILSVLLRRARFRLEGEVTPDFRRTLTPTGFQLIAEAR